MSVSGADSVCGITVTDMPKIYVSDNLDIRPYQENVTMAISVGFRNTDVAACATEQSAHVLVTYACLICAVLCYCVL